MPWGLSHYSFLEGAVAMNTKKTVSCLTVAMLGTGVPVLANPAVDDLPTSRVGSSRWCDIKIMIPFQEVN